MKSSRRTFLKTAGAAITFPTIIPSHVLGAKSPSKTIALGQIGCGRIARDMDISGLMKCKGAQYVAVADCDITRANQAKAFTKCDVKVYQDYRELIADTSIDAVVISMPDHWHAQPAIEAFRVRIAAGPWKPIHLTRDSFEVRAYADASPAKNFTIQQSDVAKVFLHPRHG